MSTREFHDMWFMFCMLQGVNGPLANIFGGHDTVLSVNRPLANILGVHDMVLPV